MPDIELIWDAECPNVGAARRLLRTALDRLGSSAHWTEWEIGSDGAPDHVAGFGSPTILVDGVDVSGGGGDQSSASCRIYAGEGVGFGGIPPLSDLLEALGSSAIGGGG
jgi:hypothetical protein